MHDAHVLLDSCWMRRALVFLIIAKCALSTKFAHTAKSPRAHFAPLLFSTWIACIETRNWICPGAIRECSAIRELDLSNSTHISLIQHLLILVLFPHHAHSPEVTILADHKVHRHVSCRQS